MYDIIEKIIQSNSISLLDQKLVNRFKQSHQRGIYFVECNEPCVEWGAI